MQNQIVKNQANKEKFESIDKLAIPGIESLSNSSAEYISGGSLGDPTGRATRDYWRRRLGLIGPFSYYRQ